MVEAISQMRASAAEGMSMNTNNNKDIQLPDGKTMSNGGVQAKVIWLRLFICITVPFLFCYYIVPQLNLRAHVFVMCDVFVLCLCGDVSKKVLKLHLNLASW